MCPLLSTPSVCSAGGPWFAAMPEELWPDVDVSPPAAYVHACTPPAHGCALIPLLLEHGMAGRPCHAEVPPA